MLRENFYAFCIFYDPVFFTVNKPHLKIICDALQLITNKVIIKLMISVPPRAGKSYTVSLWCAWMIGLNYDDPNASIMRNSYGQTLAEKFSYDIRDMIQGEKFRFVFPEVKPKLDHFRVSDWAVETSVQSTYFCSGIGGAITGKGCTLAAILDDPIKNLEDAMSETILDKTWLWYLSTHKSRLETGCPEIQIATRWSKKDPIGKLLDSEQGKDWMQIIIPALDKNGESFSAEIKTTDEYMEIKTILDSFVWEAEFMQNPIEAKGLLYPIEELHRYNGADLEKARADFEKKDEGTFFDTTFGFTDTADEGTNYLVSITAKMKEKRVYIDDVVCTQDSIEITQPIVAAQLIDNKHNSHLVESNAGGKSFALTIAGLIKDLSFCNVKWKQTVTNKETRMLMNSGQVKKYFYFRTDYEVGSDYDIFMRMLTSYVKMGKNKFDDAPDAITGVAEQIFKKNSIRVLSNKTTG